MTDPNAPKPSRGNDYCWYAVGEVKLNAAGHLAGDLQLCWNSPTDTIVIADKMTVGIDIAPGGGPSAIKALTQHSQHQRQSSSLDFVELPKGERKVVGMGRSRWTAGRRVGPRRRRT